VQLCFVSANKGWAVGYSGTIIHTTNAGANWTAQVSNTTQNLWGVDFSDTLNGWAVGWNGAIVHTANGGYLGIGPISNEIPSTLELHQNYPNPFNPTTHIRFGISESSVINLKIFNTEGIEVKVLLAGKLQPGIYEVMWDASGLPSGVYFCSLDCGSYSETRKMILLK